MEERDLRILKHVGLYRISIRPALEHALFEGRSCGNVMHRLIREGFVQYRKGLAGNYSYYQLSAKGAACVGLPRSRSAEFGAQALHAHLAILWYCFMDGTRRFRMESPQVEHLLGPDAPPGDHCLEEAAAPRMFLIYVPGPDTEVRTVRDQVVAKVHRARQYDKVRAWMEARRYAIVVFSETQERTRSLKSLLGDHKDLDGRLADQAYVRVATIPGPRTLKEALRGAAPR
ncbi:MAG: hypothetical protein HOP29_11385 [Phycisphaerales bacterium]|nr:hypothetical protein [Phycisphaerales bacterium]